MPTSGAGTVPPRRRADRVGSAAFRRGRSDPAQATRLAT